MQILPLFLLVIAAVLFLLASVGVTHPRVNFIGLGLFFWVLEVIITTIGKI